MIEIPPLDQIAIAALAVGALFLLRYFLVMRRIRKRIGYTPSLPFDDAGRSTTSGAFGEHNEPERQYAVRQLVFAGVCLAIGLGLFAWLLLAGAPIRSGV